MLCHLNTSNSRQIYLLLLFLLYFTTDSYLTLTNNILHVKVWKPLYSQTFK